MADWYVSPTGVIGNTGAIGSPWDIVSAAAGHSGAIQPGDTVWLRGGTYGFTDSTLTFTVAGAIGSGADNPDSKVIFRGYRPTISDVSTLERAIIQETSTTVAQSAGAITVNGINGSGSATVSLNKITTAQAVQAGHQFTIATGPAAGVYVITASTTLIVGNTTVSIVPNLRGATAGGEAVSIKLSLSNPADLIQSNSSFVWLMDVELAGVLPYRTWEGNGPTGWSNFNQTTDGLKLIDCIVHDLSGGTFTERTSGRQEIYGNIFYNQGYAGYNLTDGGGHHIYIHHNNANSKRLTVEGNVLFQDEGVAMQMYDAAGASGAEQNVDFLNNVCFLNGALNTIASLGGKDAQMYIIGGSQEISSINCQGNYGFQTNGNGDIFFQIGQTGQTIGVTVKLINNYGYIAGTGFGAIHVPSTVNTGAGGSLTVQGNTLVVGASDATHNGYCVRLAQTGGAGITWGGSNPNAYYRPLGVGGNACGDENPGAQPFGWRDPTGVCRTLAQFLADYGFTGDTLTKALPTATLVVTIPLNRYDNTGRGLVLYYNYAGLASIPFNPGDFGINVGDTYMVHDVRNVWAGVGGQPGTPVLGPSVWAGGTVNLPNTQVATPVMTGSQWGIGTEVTPPSTAPTFNCFLFRRTVAGAGSAQGRQPSAWGDGLGHGWR